MTNHDQDCTAIMDIGEAPFRIQQSTQRCEPCSNAVPTIQITILFRRRSFDFRHRTRAVKFRSISILVALIFDLSHCQLRGGYGSRWWYCRWSFHTIGLVVLAELSYTWVGNHLGTASGVSKRTKGAFLGIP